MKQPPSSEPTTSKAAADTMRPAADSLRKLVLTFLAKRGAEGATDEEIQDALGMDANTQRPRRWELVKSEDVTRADAERVTKSGRRATVWVLRCPLVRPENKRRCAYPAGHACRHCEERPPYGAKQG